MAKYKREVDHLTADQVEGCHSLDSNKRKMSRSHNLLAVILEVDPTQMRSRKLLVTYLIKIIVKACMEVALVGQSSNPKKKEKVGSLILIRTK